MEKMFKALLVFCAMLFVVPAFACSQPNGSMTGGACSVSELINLEKTKNVQEKTGLEAKKEIDLRPVRSKSEITKWNGNECLFGMCLYKNLLDR